MEERITLGHGGGGRLTHELVRSVFAEVLSNEWLDPLDDGALLPEPGDRLAMTTDSFVVSPVFFAGGDIGSLAVYGTVNDLAVSGARPRYLALAAILEEGLSLATLRRVVASVATAAQRSDVVVVTGDTKVVERGKGDQIFLTTTGVGVMRSGYPRADRTMAAGDAIIVSGSVGDHGAVVMAARAGVNLETDLTSDCAPVTPLVDALFDAGVVPLFMRDPTRSGVAGVLCDLAESVELGVSVAEGDVPVNDDVQAICDIVGIDPLHLASEGRVVAVVSAEDAQRALDAWGALAAGGQARCIGRLADEPSGKVVLTTRYGGARLLVRPTAEQLPRIC